jgi:hypothetical protein
MPIKINLLAEAQIAEDLRRRDPVKRAIFIGALLVALALVWSSSLQLEAMIAKRDLSQVQIAIDSKTNDYQHALVSQGRVAEANKKLDALRNLSNSRFLQGNLLNALQQATVDGVQLTRMREDQSYFRVEGSPNQTNNGHVVIGRPTTTTEKIVVSLDARDYSATPGDQVNKFKAAIAGQPYFKAMLDKTNGVQLISISPSQIGVDGKPFTLFTVECDFLEQTR